MARDATDSSPLESLGGDDARVTAPDRAIYATARPRTDC